MTYLVDGINTITNNNISSYTPPSTINDYTTPALRNAYINFVSEMQSVMNTLSQDQANQTIVTDAQYADYFQTIIKDAASLKTLAISGYQAPVDPSKPASSTNPLKNYYFTPDMLINLDLILKSLKAAGINIPDLTINPAMTTSDNLSQYFSYLPKANPTDPNVIDPQSIIGQFLASQLVSSTQLTPAALTNLRQWQNLAGFGVEQLLITGSTLPNSGKSMQSLIELQYVKDGNNIIFNNLNKLDTALNVTQNTINTLNALQGIKNLQTVTQKFYVPGRSTVLESFVGRSGYGANTGGTILGQGFPGGGSFINAYTSLGSQYFNLRFPTISGLISSNGDWMAQAQNLVTLRNQLISQLNSLEAVSPANNRNTQGTLANNIYQVIQNISKAFDGFTITGPAGIVLTSGTSAMIKNALKNWILDGLVPEIQGNKITNPDLTTTGKFQQQLSNAISAAESLNDQQKQAVNRYMFVFQEFYQSASAILTSINDIIKKMSQGISQ